jgi:predicted nucleotidyltransferase
VEPTPHAEVNALLSTLQADINEVLSDKLVGLYLYGSLITGEFDLDLSDIDIAAVVAADLDEADLARLEQMHAAIAKTNPRWDDRIEVGYISVALLRAFDPETTPSSTVHSDGTTAACGVDAWIAGMGTAPQRSDERNRGAVAHPAGHDSCVSLGTIRARALPRTTTTFGGLEKSREPEGTHACFAF